MAIEPCVGISKADLVLIGLFAPKNQKVSYTACLTWQPATMSRVLLAGENGTPLIDHYEWALASDYEAEIGHQIYMRY